MVVVAESIAKSGSTKRLTFLAMRRKASFLASTTEDHGLEDTVAPLLREMKRTERIEPAAPRKGDQHLDGRRCCGRGVIIPDSDNFWYSAWEFYMLSLLGLSCFLVPLDVVLEKGRHESPFTAASNIIDISFTIDIVMNFFKAYERVNTLGGTEWEDDNWLIARHYCSLPFSDSRGQAGWFWIDLLATGPRLLSILFASVHQHVSGVKAMAMLRALRILRFLRLHHMERLSHFMLRINVRLGFSLNVLEIVRSAFLVSLTCHWLACLWVGIESIHWRGVFFELAGFTSEKSWLSHLVDQSGDPCAPSVEEDGMCVYMLALYWSVMTITSVGYGDIVPQNHTEYVFSVFATMALALVWAYVIATVVSIVSNFNAAAQTFNQQMDELNDVCVGRQLPHKLQVQLRDYMTMSSHIPKQMAQIKMLGERLSDSLRAKITEHTRGRFLNKVWWVQDLPPVAKHEIAQRMEVHFFGAHEDLSLSYKMLFVRDGILRVNGLRVLGHGDVWGDVDVLLETEELVRDHLRTISFVDSVTLSQLALREVCQEFPAVDRRLRRAQVRCAVFRAFVRTAQARKCGLFSAHDVIKSGKRRGSFVTSMPLNRKEEATQELGLQLEQLVAAQEEMARQFGEMQQELDALARGAGDKAQSMSRQALGLDPPQLSRWR
ncbi:unnamed protein product [Prorocentrum cordatum]|uniref:Ion transport domain-containing protein n=1 Tax=Prorocentrum cordatum TaxID=2364126 RepID=A0ABN9WLZ8_9DINO|nr:unnamed protein product [Polarella glacialis]